MPTDRSQHSASPVLCLGEALIDIIATERVNSLEDANSFVARNGGAPANVAVALSRLDVPSAFCGAVGDDAFGRRIIDGLDQEHVDTSRMSRRETATTIAFAWKDERGDGQFWLLRNADSTLTPQEVDAVGIADAAAIVVGSVALAADPSRSAIHHAVHLATAAKVPVCFDVNLRPTLWRDLGAARTACLPVQRSATLLKLSLDDARGLFDGLDDPEEIVRRLDQSASSPIIVITDGERGCWYRTAANGVRFVPAIQVSAVEPTGAGDAFMAALIRRLGQRGWSAPADADIRYAAAAGALATLRPGAWDGLPRTAELDDFVRRTEVKDS